MSERREEGSTEGTKIGSWKGRELRKETKELGTKAGNNNKTKERTI